MENLDQGAKRGLSVDEVGGETDPGCAWRPIILMAGGPSRNGRRGH